MKKMMTTILMTLSLTGFAADVDMKKSSFTWHGSKVTGKHYGEVSLKSAKIDLDKKGHISSGELVIDLNSITISDLEGEWAQKFIGHIKSEDFFEVKKFPTAKLVVKSDNGKKITGDLTIKGKTHPVTFDYKKNANVYEGTLEFDRTKFDMIYGSKSFFKSIGDKAIHNEVKLDFKLALK